MNPITIWEVTANVFAGNLEKNDSAMNNSGDLLPAYSKEQQQCSSKNCQDHTDIFTVYTATETARGAGTTITHNLNYIHLRQAWAPDK